MGVRWFLMRPPAAVLVLPLFWYLHGRGFDGMMKTQYSSGSPGAAVQK